jgi:hypothetical protein
VIVSSPFTEQLRVRPHIPPPFRYLSGNIHGTEPFCMGFLFGADSQPPVSGSGVLPLREGLGRVTVLLQLKVNRLCLVVDGTADFDPKRKQSGGRIIRATNVR